MYWASFVTNPHPYREVSDRVTQGEKTQVSFRHHESSTSKKLIVCLVTTNLLTEKLCLTRGRSMRSGSMRVANCLESHSRAIFLNFLLRRADVLASKNLRGIVVSYAANQSHILLSAGRIPSRSLHSQCSSLKPHKHKTSWPTSSASMRLYSGSFVSRRFASCRLIGGQTVIGEQTRLASPCFLCMDFTGLFSPSC